MIHGSTASATMPLKTQLHTCAFDLMTRRLGSLAGAGTGIIFFVATNTYLSHFLSLTFTGGSWHKCHFFCRDKHVFVSLSLSLTFSQPSSIIPLLQNVYPNMSKPYIIMRMYMCHSQKVCTNTLT